MEVSGIIDIINGVGFPIAVSIALFWQNYQQNEKYTALLSELTTIIDNNTSSINVLSDELRGIVGD